MPITVPRRTNSRRLRCPELYSSMRWFSSSLLCARIASTRRFVWLRLTSPPQSACRRLYTAYWWPEARRVGPMTRTSWSSEASPICRRFADGLAFQKQNADPTAVRDGGQPASRDEANDVRPQHRRSDRPGLGRPGAGRHPRQRGPRAPRQRHGGGAHDRLHVAVAWAHSGPRLRRTRPAVLRGGRAPDGHDEQGAGDRRAPPDADLGRSAAGRRAGRARCGRRPAARPRPRDGGLRRDLGRSGGERRDGGPARRAARRCAPRSARRSAGPTPLRSSASCASATRSPTPSTGAHSAPSFRWIDVLAEEQRKA